MSATISNPQISQGVINVVRASLQVPSYPALNVSVSFMGARGASISWTTPATTFINTLTGRIPCPEPFQACMIGVPLIRSQSLASQWETQRINLSLIGDVLIYSDSSTLPPYSVSNCAIENVGELSFNGKSAEFYVTISGTYSMNNNLWNLVL